MDYKKLFEFIITEIKKLKGLTMLFIFISSIACLLLDWFIIRHYVTHTAVLDIYRSIYFICGFFSSVFLVNKIADKIEQKKAQEKENREYEYKIENYYKIVKPVLKSLSLKQNKFLHQFIEQKTLSIICENTTQNINFVNFIIGRLYGTNLSLYIAVAYPNLLINIDQITYDVLAKHFSAGLKNK